MRKITIDDLIVELDNASKLASECQKPSAMIAATLAKAKLLGLDKPMLTVAATAQAPIFNIMGVAPKVERHIIDTVANTVKEY